MINFKELLISKIIAVAVIITFSVTTAAYGIDLSERNYLRVPVGQKATYERVDDTRGSLEDQKTPIDPQSDKDSKKKKIRFSDLSIPVATGLFAVVFAISFLRAEYTTAVHLFGIGVGAFLGLASVLYTFYRIRKPHSVSKSKALIKITIASCIMVANIFYTTKLRDLPHDVRVVTTKFFSLVHRINMLGGDRETKILLPSEKEIIHIKPSGARKGFRYAELDIIHKGILTFKDKLRYVVVDPKRYDIKVAHGNSTLSLVKESGAIAGINGSYISKNLTPIGLLIQDGKTLFPYTSENIEVELIDGTKMIVLSDNYFEENPPFNNIGSIKYAVQHAPDGLLIEDGKIVRDINNSYVNRLMAQEAIFAVLENGSVSIVPSDYYIKNIYPFDGSVKVIQALQTGPLTFYEGISVKSVKMNVEAVRGKVAYAIDANDNLYLLTTDSIRGIYGMTYTQFTNELIEHGKENGIQFKSIAFGDAGGSGTLTVLDEETGNYKISGAGVKYMSSSAILVFPHKTVSLEAAKEEIIDIDTISLEKLVSYSKENLKTLKIIIEQYPEKIKEFLLNSDSKEFTITIDLLINNYLSAFEEAPEKLRDMFIDIAKESPERGLMFLYALGPEYIDRVFVNYYMGDMISVEEGDKLEMIEKIIMPNVFASNPKKVAEFLEKLDRYGIDIDSLPTPLYKLPSKDFDSRDSGLWIIEFYAKYNKEALDLIDALDSVSSEVTLARLFEHLIRSHGNKVYIKLLEGLAERKGIDWVKRYIHITITQYLPPFEEYYEEFAVGIRKTINSVSKPLRQVIEKELQNIDIDIDTLKQKDMDSFKGIGRSTYIVERTMLRTDLFSDPNKDEDPQRELKALLAALKNGKIDNIPQSLYVIIAVKDVPLEDKFLVLEKLKMLVEDNIDARNGIRRISDISLLNNINQGLKDAAIDYLVSLYKHNNPIVLKDIRALLVLATQDKDLKVKAKATSFINKLNFIDIPYRLKWSHDWPWLQPHLYIKLAQELQKEGVFETREEALQLLKTEQEDTTQKGPIDVNTISLEQLVTLSRENPQTLKTIIDRYPAKIDEFLLDSNQEEFSIIMDLLINSYLGSFENASARLVKMFTNLAKKSPERGLMFLYALGPEYIDKAFENVEPLFQWYNDNLGLIEDVFAFNPQKAAELLNSIDVYGVNTDRLPMPLYKILSKKFHNLDTGLWVVRFYNKYNKETLQLIDSLDSMEGKVTLARLFRALIQPGEQEAGIFIQGSEVCAQLLEELVKHKGMKWVEENIHITISEYLPRFEEYYERYLAHIKKTIDSVSAPLREVIEKELENVGVNINATKRIELDKSKGIGKSTYIIHKAMLETGVFSRVSKYEHPQRELKTLLAALKKGEIDNIPQSLYVIIAVKDVPLEDKFLVLEKLKMLVEDNIDARNGIRRISDISLLNNINQGLKDAAIDYLVSLYKHNNPIVLKDIRALLVLATQDKDLKVKAKATSFINKLNFIDIPYRLKWSHDWPWLQPHLYIKLAQELQKEGVFETREEDLNLEGFSSTVNAELAGLIEQGGVIPIEETDYKDLAKLGLVKRLKSGDRYYCSMSDFTADLTPEQLDYIYNLPELNTLAMTPSMITSARRRIYGKIQDLSDLEDEDVFFLGEEVRGNIEGFKSALKELKSNNRPVILVNNIEEKEEMTRFINGDISLKAALEIKGLKLKITSFEEADIDPEEIDPYKDSILGIDNIHFILPAPAELKLHPGSRAVRTKM